MDTAEICMELRNMADGICAKLKRQCEQYESTIRALADGRDALAAKLECVQNELEAVKDQYASALAEYVELADHGIVRDSIIRDLFKRLSPGQATQSHVPETERRTA